MAERNDKVPIPFFELVWPDRTKTFKRKTWLERFRQNIEKTEEVEVEPMLNGKQKPKWNMNTTEKRKKIYRHYAQLHYSKWLR